MNFSIITPTFNSRTTLREAVEGVLEQQGVALEYLIIDGGSTDGTVELIEELADGNSCIRSISEPDCGIADAFNKGLAMASGDWIGILNSDDCYASGALATVAAAIEANPGVDVIHGNMLRLDEEGRPLFILHPADLDSAIWHQMPLNHPTVFVSRRAYERVGGFDRSLRIAMDYDLILRLYKAGAKFVYLDRTLAHMRYGGASDDQLWAGLREVYAVSIRHGFPAWKAAGWLLYRGVLGWTKTTLRAFGLEGLLTWHPRFDRHDTDRRL